MKMSSKGSFDRYARRRRVSRAPLLFGVLLLVVLALAAYFRAEVGGALWQAAAPVVALRNTLGATENEELRQQLLALQASLADRALLYQENLELKARLGRTDIEAPRLLAAVLQGPPGMPYDTLLLDVGTDNGVTVGDYVAAGGTTLIGTVTEVHAQTARVGLFSAPGQEHQALLYPAGSAPAALGGTVPLALEGQGGGSLRTQLPAGAKVRVGDYAVVPGLLGFTATVSHVELEEGESLMTVYFGLGANPQGLRFVEVWQGSALSL